MKPTEGELIQIQSQAEFMAMSFGTHEWKLMAATVKELRGLRGQPEGTLIQRQGDRWIALMPDGETREIVYG